jgi:protein tyrosine kinase modulator
MPIDDVRQQTGLDRALVIWKRRKWLALMALAAALSMTLGLVAFLPNLYRASAVILVERQQVPEAFVRSTVTSGLETRLPMISQDILSRDRLEELIVRLDLYSGLRRHTPMEVVVDRMRSDIDVDLRGTGASRRGGNLVAFEVSYAGTTPSTTALVANTLASYYLEENSKARERQASGTADFLRRQLQEVKQRLEGQEQRLSGFKTKYLGETPQHMPENLAMLDRLNTQLRLNSERQTRAMGRRESLIQQLADSELHLVPAPPTTPGTPVPPPDAGLVRLARLRQELAELQTRFSDRYPDVVRLKTEIASLERDHPASTGTSTDRPAGEEVVGPAPDRNRGVPPTPYTLQLKATLAQAETELRALQTEERRLNDDVLLYQRRVENTPRREQEFQTLSRDYGTMSDLYRTLLQRYEEAQLAESLEQHQQGEQFRIVERAVVPSAPFAPRRGRLAVMALVGSIALAVGAVLLRERIDTSLHSVNDLRMMAGAAVTIRIPRIITEADRRRGGRKRGLVFVAIALLCLALGGGAYLVAGGHVPMVSPLVQAAVLKG